jgi:TolB protein
MNKLINFSKLLPMLLIACGVAQAAEGPIEIIKSGGPGHERPILVTLSGFTGEADQVLRFDLYVQGFAVSNEQEAQYIINGSNNGNLQGRIMDRLNKSTVVAKAYSGGSIRRQAHAFIDDFVQTLGRKPIGNTKIAFKAQNGSNGEIFIADFDGFNAQQVTRDNSIVAAPCMVPGHLAVYYTSYKLNHPDIFYQNLSTGARQIFSRHGGSSLSPAVSPDGSKVAMILSKDGWTDLYVGNSDRSDVRRLTASGFVSLPKSASGVHFPKFLSPAALLSGSRLVAWATRPSRTGLRTANGLPLPRREETSPSAWCRQLAATPLS